MSRLLVAQRALTVPGWAKDALWRRAQAVPSLDLPFAENKSLTDAVTGQSLITFTRASSATYIDSAGTLRSAVTNLLLRSEEFDNASWTKTRSSITADSEIAPNGTLTADKVVEDTTASATHLVLLGSGIIAGNTYTYSVYAKSAGRNWIVLSPGGNWGFAWFNISSGTIGTVTSGGSSATAAIQPVGNGWYRCSVTSTAVDNRGLQILVTTGNDVVTYTGDGTSGVFLWGAQLEQASTVGEYIPTTSAINSAPRFDHNPTTGESLGLLVEDQRANLLSYSEDTSQWLTPTNITLSQNQTTAPDGASTADQYLETAATGLHVQDGMPFTFVTSTAYTYSVFVKSIGGRNFEIGYPPTTFTNRFARFNLSGSGSVQGSDAGVTASIQAYANGWYRCSATNTCASGASARISNFVNNDSFARSYAGDVTKGLFIWGAQLEAGAFPTSYIPTTTAAATRSADVASITGANFSSWYRQNEGTVFAESSSFSNLSGSRVVSAIDDGSMSNRFQITFASGYTPNFAAVSAGTVSADLYASAPAQGFNTRFCTTYGVNDFVLSSNGGNSVTDTSGALPISVSTARLGVFQNNTGYLNGTIRRLTFFPQRLPSSTLEAITR